MKVQVAFQGGGAKFVEMLPTLAALQELKNQNRIEITQVSGSSAGSICAALLALDASIDKLRSEIKKDNGKILKSTSTLFGGTVSKLHYTYLVPKILFGFPAVSPKKFHSFLTKIFQWSIENFSDSENSIECILASDVKPNLFISSANLKQGKGGFARHGSLISAISESCAFPLALKNYRDLEKSPNVDGGLTENLPTSVLGEDSEFGIKILVCPVEKSQIDGQYISPNNAFTYLYELFSTAVNNQVERAKKDESNAFLLDIESELRIHDIQSAFDKITSDEWYQNKKLDIRQRLLEFLDMHPIQSNERAFLNCNLPAPYYRKSLYSVYSNLFSDQNYEVELLLHIVKAESLYKGGSAHKFDRVEREAYVRTGENGLSCFRSFARRNGSKQVPTGWDAWLLDDNGKKTENLPITPIPIDTPENEARLPGSVLLFFDNVDPRSLGNQRICIRSINYDPVGMNELRKVLPAGTQQAPRDFIGFTHHHNVPAQKAGAVLLVPTDYGTMIPQPHHQCDDTLQCFKFSEDEIRNLLGLDSDYRASGMYTENLPAKSLFKVDFVRGQ